MAERPILFSAPMVRALLDGRKTQTRRVVKPQPAACDHGHWPDAPPPTWKAHPTDGWWCSTCGNGVSPRRNFNGFPCPYGVPGDLLWVREAHALHERFTDVVRVVYGASLPGSWTEATGEFPAHLADGLKIKPYQQGFRPSIHMPRWASRIRLRVTDVRVERLNDISEADAESEGARTVYGEPFDPNSALTDRRRFELLWEHINGPGSWDANPWVWAVSFERVVP